MKERYPGTIGRTHGEMNDKNPKSNAVNMDTFVSTVNPSRNVIVYGIICINDAEIRRLKILLTTGINEIFPHMVYICRMILFPDNPDFYFTRDFVMKFYRDGIDAENLYRFFKLYDTLIEAYAFFLECIGDHLRSD